MHPSRRAARTFLALFASATLTASVVAGVAPAQAYTPVVKPYQKTVAVGDQFTIAMIGNGAMYATGTNTDNQLPGLTVGTTPVTTLTQIDALPDATLPVAVAAGQAHSVALGANGKVYAVGLNNVGQLANGFTNVASPATWAPVLGLPAEAFPVKQVAAAGLNTYVLGSNGEVYGAGWNDNHQISATGSSFNTMTLIDVPGTSQVTQIAAGGPVTGFGGFLVARNSGGYVFGRGGNDSGQLNQPVLADVTTMTLFPGSSGNATTIAAGGASSYYATTTNTVLAVGKNTSGQLGNNSTSQTSTLVTMTPPTGGFVPVALAAGGDHVLVAAETGDVYAAGQAGAGAVASGSSTPDKLVLAPVDEAGGVTIGTAVEVAAGDQTSIIRNIDGLVLGAGDGFHGQLTGALAHKLSVIQLTGQFLNNYVLPTITSPVKVGELATATQGSWSVKPTGFAYSWFNNGVAISGATSQTYTIKPEDYGDPITVKVMGSRSGFANFTYESLAVVPGAGTLSVDSDPVITGTPAVGEVLGIDEGTWTPAASYSAYQWRRNGTSIPLATTDTYTLQQDDLGQDIDAVFTGSSTGYFPLNTSTDTVTVAAGTFSNVTRPSIAGTMNVGRTIKVSNGTWSTAPSGYTYQWMRDGAPIAGAVSQKYLLTKSDAGKSITGEVFAAATGYAVASEVSGPRTVALHSSKRPTFSGTAKVGKTLKLKTKGTWTPKPTSYTYRWNRNGKPIKGATKSTYKLKKADKGKYLTLTVTAKKAGIPNGTSTSAKSKKVK